MPGYFIEAGISTRSRLADGWVSTSGSETKQ
jgi:hypothetical protein